MDTSLWSQLGSDFSDQFSVFSPTTAAPEGDRDGAARCVESIRLFFATQTFQTFARAVDEDELLIAQLRENTRSRRADDSDSEPCFVRTRCYDPALGRFLRREPL